MPRRLVVDGTTWLWSVRHRHRNRHDDCRESLTLRRADAPHAQLRLVFRAVPGRLIRDAYWPSGALGDTHGNNLNLHEPGVVRRFLDEASARGLLPTAHGVHEVDGWPLFDALAVRASPGQDQRPVRPSSRAVAAVPAVEVRRTLRPSR
ncbi:hypothetical protein GCM10010393_04380 [Streptomyces gobitricini]|uniref:Uncharacterized protein n=1 Tax=Streptomyces gobitricini TaxID=68211 RepID=A0ABP5Y9R8_9ACTN